MDGDFEKGQSDEGFFRHFAPILGFIFGDDGYTFVANGYKEGFEWVVAKIAEIIRFMFLLPMK
ncbi:hypothetical protein [Aeromonas sp. 601027]|uniref:hypothetical protein n=1 Tax=Aeromonas TaxID=642 RepID=UPI003B9FA6B1